MVAQRMGSHGGVSDNTGVTQTQTQTQIQIQDQKSNSLSREGSFYNLTLDEVQTQLGDLGKPLSSMNLDEFLKSVCTAEANNQTHGGNFFGLTSHQPGPTSTPAALLNRQSSLTLSKDLSKKTVHEVWQDIQQKQKRCTLDGKTTLGEITLEDFLVKAGVVAESPQGMNNSASDLSGVDSMILPQPPQWMNYQIPTIPVFAQGHQVQQQSISLCGNTMMDITAYPETQMAMTSSPLMGNLSDTHAPGRKRAAAGDIVEKCVERRQKRMIKNRESAARSRARKQAYTHELENKVSRLEEENERLKRQKEWEEMLPNIQPPQAKHQLRRTSSAPV